MPFKLKDCETISERSAVAGAVFSLPVTDDSLSNQDVRDLATSIEKFGEVTFPRKAFSGSLTKADILAHAKKSAAEYLTQTSEYKSWANKFATVDAAIGAVNRNDAAKFELILYNLRGANRDNAQLGFELSDQVNKIVKGMIRLAQETEDRPRLQAAARIAQAAIENGVHFDANPNNAITTQTLTVGLHQQGLYRTAARLVEASLKAGASLKQETVLSTLSLAGQSIRSRGHMVEYAELAKHALKSGIIDVTDKRAIRVYDVVLASLGAPELHDNPETGRFMNERSLIDVSLRLIKAGEVALAVSDAGMRFDSDRNEARMNMLIRGLTTGAFAITCQSLKLITKGDLKFHRKLDRYFNIDTEYPWLGPRALMGRAMPDRAAELALTALELSNRALRVEDAPARKDPSGSLQMYQLQGSTVNSVLKCIHDTGIDVDGFTAFQIGSLVEGALNNPAVSRKLHSRHLTMGLKSLIRSESEVARYEAVRILASSLDRGFGFDRSVIQAVYDASGIEYRAVSDLIPRQFDHETEIGSSEYVAAGVVAAFDKEGLAALQRLERILMRPARSDRPSPIRLGVTNDKARERVLAGGLGPIDEPVVSKAFTPWKIPSLSTI